MNYLNDNIKIKLDELDLSKTDVSKNNEIITINLFNFENEKFNDEDLYKYSLKNDLLLSKELDYNQNYTIKQLMMICDYYGISKQIKTNKCNKQEIINIILLFETNIDNEEIVFKRQNMWFYINELKNDKFMKKYILLP